MNPTSGNYALGYTKGREEGEEIIKALTEALNKALAENLEMRAKLATAAKCRSRSDLPSQ